MADRGKEGPDIVVEGLTARFGGVTILDRVSLSVAAGEVLCVVGASGCGKSTLLKHMIGLLRPAAGRILVAGEDLVTAEEGPLRRIRRGIGVLFQSDALLGSLTLGENIALPLEGFTGLTAETIRGIVRMKLGLVGLEGYEDHFPAELSGGMRKRGGLARAMALDPRILFFDEPSAGLDPINAAELENLILTLNAGLGTTMIVVSHQVDLVLRVAHRIIMLDREAKGIIAEGTPGDLAETARDERVRRFLFRQAPAAEREVP